MRKLRLLATSGLALLGFAAFGSQAAWATHPGEPVPYCQDEAHGVQGFHVLINSPPRGAAAKVIGGAAHCGTKLEGLFNGVKGAYWEPLDEDAYVAYYPSSSKT